MLKVVDEDELSEGNIATLSDERYNKLLEELASYAHEVWSGWMKYMFENCEIQIDRSDEVGVIVPKQLYERWKFQMDTSYDNLPENMKPSDRDEARKMMDIFMNYVGIYIIGVDK